MSTTILLPNIRYILGFKNREERLIQRTYKDFFFDVQDQLQITDVVLFQKGYCKALTSLILEASSLSEDDNFLDKIIDYFPKEKDNYIVEEVEIKFNDKDLLLLQMNYINKLSIEAISARCELSTSDVTNRVQQLTTMWSQGQDLPIEEYLLQIEKRNIYKRLEANLIPISKDRKRKKDTNKVGAIQKVDPTFWERIKGFFS
ncbi:hypothetical protein [Flammeovirga kamogawensis]|uniref:DnaD domain-containing protein n=1 Tax=Flammeovirga kamogawensis TaxID=373891 RepID=A0ABX8GVA8_9BACT|nr:hypothetical protein [Flammeovirga kamogawensis]MBB6461621.1 hypothetical protein [Flammeovirga kamogawensis]QWG07451.1 hypothetical protein KM029_00470 [Flammeovirga kamogawensis]TRX69263.1 hypothetical protein EO216_14415 [Flammeovirga kamogawensis]